MTVDDVVAASIARARRNVETGFPFDHGADVDEILRSLGLPVRTETVEPFWVPAVIRRESGARRKTRRGRR